VAIEQIGPPGPSRITGASRARSARPADAPAERPDHDAPRVPVDRIDLSAAARELVGLPPETPAPAAPSAPAEPTLTPEERQAIVGRLKDEVINGTYRPDADSVARRMVDLGDV
jgi:hypothetical protein